jgi:hypothetical protein
MITNGFRFFHKAHPFVLPQRHLIARMESDPASLQYLVPVIQYVGSLYASDIPSVEYRDVALGQFDSPGIISTGFNVQALIIAAIATHCEDNAQKSRLILDMAIYKALEIGMNSLTFANAERDPVLAESWRRTWWSLYITDGGFATISYPAIFM